MITNLIRPVAWMVSLPVVIVGFGLPLYVIRIAGITILALIWEKERQE